MVTGDRLPFPLIFAPFGTNVPLMTLSYLIWNWSPEIFTWGWLSLRWYGLLFALGFLLSQQILYYMFKKEGKPQSDVDTLTIYMVISTILGARLGHILFYQPEIIWEDPLGVLLPFQFTPTFEFTGLRGLASHGAAFGILFALWLYSNYLIIFSRKPGSELQFEDQGNEVVKHKIKKGFNIIKRVKFGQNYIQTLDRIVILVALTGALIRLGNFFNSEIIGKPTDSGIGVVFAGDLTRMLTKSANSPVDFVEVKKNLDAPPATDGRQPVNIYLFFKEGTPQSSADAFVAREGKYFHAVCIVGYDDGKQCWIMKNSWGPGWGESGFMLIAYGQCDIDSAYAFYDPEIQITGGLV